MAGNSRADAELTDARLIARVSDNELKAAGKERLAAVGTSPWPANRAFMRPLAMTLRRAFVSAPGNSRFFLRRNLNCRDKGVTQCLQLLPCRVQLRLGFIYVAQHNIL